MTDRLKYLIYKAHGLVETPVIFDPSISHASMAAFLAMSRTGGEVVAGGFLVIMPCGSRVSVHTMGESISTGKKSRGLQDDEILTKWLNDV